MGCIINVLYIEVMYIICTLLLAGKDADSYLLKNNLSDKLTLNRVSRWHRDGFFLALAIVILCVMVRLDRWWVIISTCILIRLSFFDIFYNRWSGLGIDYIGNTAWTDQQLRKIFGSNGAVLKSITFFILLLIFNYIFRGRL